MGSTLKGKNLLLGEQILSFSVVIPFNKEKMEMTQLLPLKVYPFTLTMSVPYSSIFELFFH